MQIKALEEASIIRDYSKATYRYFRKPKRDKSSERQYFVRIIRTEYRQSRKI